MFQMSATRRNRLLLVLALITFVLVVAWVARGALAPYVFALLLGYLMVPLVNLLDRLLRRVFRGRAVGFARPVAIALVYLLTIGGLALFFSLVVPVIVQQFTVLWDSREQLVSQGRSLIAGVVVWYQENVPAEFQTQVNQATQQIAAALAKGVQTGVVQTVSFVTNTVSFILGLIIIPFFLFYILLDQARVTRGAFNLVPPRFRMDALNLFRIVDDILSAYIRGQLLLCVFIGLISTAGLMALGVRFPAVLGLVAGVFEILPFVGPLLGLIVASTVAVIQEPILGLWTAVLFLGIQQVENIFLVPRISGKAVELHPAVIMVVLVVGQQLAGLWGMVLAVPVTAIIRDIFKYLYLRLQDAPLSPRDAMLKLGRTPLQLEV